MDSSYHYTESGLETVFLANGYSFVNSQGGQQVIIEDIEGLHVAIGFALATQEHRLNGKEVRFLRSELLLSQAMLAKILRVKVLTVNRWERDDPPIPVATEAVLRKVYLESIGEDRPMRPLLEKLADLEDELDKCITLKKSKVEHGKWEAVDLQLVA
jgi:putative transcriptional regulator